MIRDNGRALVRYGRRPKRAVLFQTNEPFDKISTPIFISPNGDAHRVRSAVQWPAIRRARNTPDTGMAYAWEGGEPGSVPRNDLPNLDAKSARPNSLPRPPSLCAPAAGPSESGRKTTRENQMEVRRAAPPTSTQYTAAVSRNGPPRRSPILPQSSPAWRRKPAVMNGFIVLPFVSARWSPVAGSSGLRLRGGYSTPAGQTRWSTTRAPARCGLPYTAASTAARPCRIPILMSDGMRAVPKRRLITHHCHSSTCRIGTTSQSQNKNGRF